VWHPSRGSDADHLRRIKQQHPDLRIVPRTPAQNVDAMLDAGAEGAVVHFRSDAAMREFAQHYLQRV
jgi:hypothetical protein